MFPDIFGQKDYKDDTTIKPIEIFVVWYPSYPTFLNGKISKNLLNIVIRNVGWPGYYIEFLEPNFTETFFFLCPRGGGGGGGQRNTHAYFLGLKAPK